MGADENGKIIAADVSEWEGICIAYTLDHAANLDLVPDAIESEKIQGDNPFVTLNKSTDVTTKCYKWDVFEQAGYGVITGGARMSGPEAAQNLARVQIEFRAAKAGDRGTFNIMAISSYLDVNGNSPQSSSSSVKPKSSSSIVAGGTGIVDSRWVWYGSDGSSLVETSLGNGASTSGYWFSFDDHADGGQSFIKWPVERNTFYSEDQYDVSAWGGVCVNYKSDLPMRIALGLSKEDQAILAYDIPYVSLPKTTSGSVKCFSWEQFNNTGKAGEILYGDQAAKKLVNIQFRFQGQDGITGNFNIMSVSDYSSYAGIVAGN